MFLKNCIPLLLSICFFSVYATASDTLDCYQKWGKAFKERGSKKIEQGEHINVVISIRQKVKNEDGEYTFGTITNCYSGKVVVKGKDVIEIYLKIVDNTYEKLDKKYKYTNLKATIENGITKNIVTEEGSIINIIFHEQLKGKSAERDVAKLKADDM